MGRRWHPGAAHLLQDRNAAAADPDRQRVHDPQVHSCIPQERPDAGPRERDVSFDIRNLRWLRTLNGKMLPENFGPRLYELLSDHIQATRNIETQTNANGGGNALPP